MGKKPKKVEKSKGQDLVLVVVIRERGSPTDLRYSRLGSTILIHFSLRKITLASLRKFLPMMKSSVPPLMSHCESDFLLISGVPSGWVLC